MTVPVDVTYCPICGKKSLAFITDHICSKCEELYIYCLDHSDESKLHSHKRPPPLSPEVRKKRAEGRNRGVLNDLTGEQ